MESSDARHYLRDEKYRLETVRAELADTGPDTGADRSDFMEGSAADQHQADLGTDTFNRERDLSILETVEAELADIERALSRLDDGTYGICEVCGSGIADERLEVLPAARYCVDHQLQAEHPFSPQSANRPPGGEVGD